MNDYFAGLKTRKASKLGKNEKEINFVEDDVNDAPVAPVLDDTPVDIDLKGTIEDDYDDIDDMYTEMMYSPMKDTWKQRCQQDMIMAKRVYNTTKKSNSESVLNKCYDLMKIYKRKIQAVYADYQNGGY